MASDDEAIEIADADTALASVAVVVALAAELPSAPVAAEPAEPEERATDGYLYAADSVSARGRAADR